MNDSKTQRTKFSLSSSRLPSFLYIKDYFADETYYAIEMTEGAYQVRICEAITDTSHPLGFGTYINTKDELIFVAYFSSTRNSIEVAPNYDEQLFLLVGTRIYDFSSGKSAVCIRRGLFERKFVVQIDGIDDYVISYNWPIYREFFGAGIGDPFNFTSKDFLYEFVRLAKFSKNN